MMHFICEYRDVAYGVTLVSPDSRHLLVWLLWLPLVDTAVYFHILPSEAEAQRVERTTRRSCNCEVVVLDNSSSQKTHISFLHTHLYFLWSIWEECGILGKKH